MGRFLLPSFMQGMTDHHFGEQEDSGILGPLHLGHPLHSPVHEHAPAEEVGSAERARAPLWR